MARTPNKPRPPVPMADILPEKAAAIEAAQDANALAAAQADEVLAAGIDIGRLEALDFVAMVATSAILPIYEHIKKSKAWQHLRNPQSGDGRHFESLEEFCEVKLGKSYRRLRELSANRNLIGQEAFEQAERIGLRQVDYNAIKALPAPKQEIVREALAEGASKEEVQRALRELAAADQKEIEALTAARDEAQAGLHEAKAEREAKDQVIARLKAQLNKGALAEPTPDEQAQALLKAVQDAEATACAWVDGHLREAIAAVLAYDDATDGDHNAILSGYIAHVEDATDRLREMFGLPRNLIESGAGDDPLGELPDDFLEQQGLVMPEPINAKPKG